MTAAPRDSKTNQIDPDPDLEDEYIGGWVPAPRPGPLEVFSAAQRSGGEPTPPDKPFTLFTAETLRLVGDYASEADALDAVLLELCANRDGYDLVLMHLTTRKNPPYVAARAALVDRALRAEAAKGVAAKR